MIGLLTLSQYLFNWNLGIDQLVFREIAGAVGTSHPGRMAPNTALNFLLLGLALLLLHRRTRRDYWLVQFLTLTAAWVSLPGLIGYLYGVKSLYGIASYTQMALHTVLTFIVLCIGILLVHPDQGVMKIVTSNTTGGFIARRLLVAAIAFPSGLGWLILQGYRAGLYNTAFGLALLVMVSIVVFAVWIWQNAQTLDRIDSERSWAEQALRESEERYRAFIEQSSEGIWRFELEQPLSIDCPEDEQIQHFYQYGYLAECNKVMAQMYGFSEAQEIVGVRLANFLVPSDPHNIEYLRNFIRCGYRLNDAESHEVDKHGLAKYFLNNLVGIVENGLLVRAWGSQRDISDRKQAQEALQETNQTLQALIQASPLAIITLNTDGNLKMWSPAAERIFGWTEQEVLDRPVPFVPEDKQEEFQRLHQVKLQGNSLTGLEVRRQKKDGSPIDIALWAAPLKDSKGNIYSTMAVIADITERKRTQEALRESEERFRRLVESNIFGAAFGNFSGEIHYANDYFLKMVGYEREELMQGKLGWTQMTPPEFLHLDARAAEELKTYGVATPFEKEYIRKDGTRVPILIGGALLKEPYDQQQEVAVFYVDLTERKQAESALRESEERFRKFFEEAPIGISVIGLDGRFLKVNKTYCQMLGYLEQELHQLTFAAITHPEDVDKDLSYTEQLFKGEIGSYQIEKRYIKKNGEILWVNLTATAIFDQDGNVRYGLGMVEDISDRKRTQEELQDTNQTLQALIQSCPLAITVFSLDDGKVKMWNPAAEKIFGWSEQEALGRFLPSIPEDKQDEFLANLASIKQGKALTGRETRRQKKDGTPIDISVWAAPLHDAKGNISCMSIVADISDRKQAEETLRQSEERLRLALDAGKAGIWDWDIPNNQVTWSERIYEFHGLVPGTFGGKVEDFAALIHPEEQERVSAAIQKAIEEKTPYQIEFRILQPSGAVRWISTKGRVIYDATGVPVRMLGATIDITERKAAEEERELLLTREQAARAEAEAANRMKDEFLATLSHELRTPLNAMLGWTQMLRTRKLDEAKAARALETIDRNAKSLSQLIEDVLDVSRIITGKLHLNVRPVELVPVIEAAIETVLPAANAKDIGIEARLDPSSGTVLGDANRLQQVVWNLLSNAVKFTPKGGRVEVRLELIDSHVQIRVSDTGQGISPEFLPYVFERFRQADSTTTRSHGGLGLGLAIVRHLVELQGGTVHVESAGIGQGATFIVNLPIRAVRPATSEPELVQPMLRNEAPTLSPAILNGLRVLVVDDEADARELLTTLLGQYGAEVIAVATASEALETLQRLKPNVLVSDIGMPGEDGYALIRKVRLLDAEQGRQIPAVALTAYARAEDRINALGAGFQLHIPKPVNPEELAAVVANLAGRAGHN
jgi:PAS domain S-box-containing protein